MTGSIENALTKAGAITRAVARNLAATDHTFNDGNGPDDRRAMSDLANALIEDATRHSLLNDRHILHTSGYALDIKQEARRRMNSRVALADALCGLRREARIALIDALADGRATAAA